MPMAIVNQLRTWKHNVDLLEPQASITNLCHLTKHHYDAYILKTVSDGPGLSLLAAAEAIGIPTINNSHAIRLVRDKAVAMALAHAHDIPTPHTYFVADPRLLQQVPPTDYPLVVKATNGSCGRGIYLIKNPAELATLRIAEAHNHFFLAQRYIKNMGFDIKIYVVGNEVFSVVKGSPLHPKLKVEKRCVSTSAQLHELALRIGSIFGLDIYGLDVIETPHGPFVVDINDFPSFELVSAAIPRIASYILHIAHTTKHQHTPIPLFKQNDHQSTHHHTKSVEILSAPKQQPRQNSSGLLKKVWRNY
jgi:ribosomal protein S6--L-glutamate ligase